MNRCHECDAPLPINGTHCKRCNAPRNDIEEQNRARHRHDGVVRFLGGVLSIFVSVTFFMWFAGCAAIGAAVGCTMYYGFDIHPLFCWIAGVVVTFFGYGLSWATLIFGD